LVLTGGWYGWYAYARACDWAGGKCLQTDAVDVCLFWRSSIWRDMLSIDMGEPSRESERCQLCRRGDLVTYHRRIPFGWRVMT
jgi:hypothetical protein